MRVGQTLAGLLNATLVCLSYSLPILVSLTFFHSSFHRVMRECLYSPPTLHRNIDEIGMFHLRTVYHRVELIVAVSTLIPIVPSIWAPAGFGCDPILTSAS